MELVEELLGREWVKDTPDIEAISRLELELLETIPVDAAA